ncbi:MAG: diacylglycerol kinase family lipid kinase [Butyrivibrio sp.]|nr:diacylglycerol kinase family lipid kinase [Butyrivibrio sp.]
MYYCIINPSARSGRGGNIWGILENKFKEKNIPYKVVFTNGPGHAIKIANKLTQKESEELPIKIVVMGGDGTLNEVVSGIQDFDKVLLGYIPVGSSNDFVRDMNLPSNKEEIMDRILEGKELRRVDLGLLRYNHMTKTLSRLHDADLNTTRHFDVSSGIGFDAAVCEEALASNTKNFLNKLHLGKLTYLSIAIRQIVSAKKIPCDIELDDGQTLHLDHFLFVAAMIHPYEGGGFKFAPDAVHDDGYFNICIVGDLSVPKSFMALPFAYVGKHYNIKGIYHFKARRITIKTMLPMWVHTDGEVYMKSDSITMECLEKKLSLMI